VERDDSVIAELEAEVIAFLNEVRATVQQLQRLYDPKPANVSAEYLMAG